MVKLLKTDFLALTALLKSLDLMKVVAKLVQTDVQMVLIKLKEIAFQLMGQVEIWMTTPGEKTVKNARDGEVQMVNGNKNAGNLKTMAKMVRFSVPQLNTMAMKKAFG